MLKQLALTACIVTAATAFAAGRPVSSATPAEADSIPSVTMEARPNSAGIVPALERLPEGPRAQLRFTYRLSQVETTPAAEPAKVVAPVQQASVVSPLESLPLATKVRKVGADRFNTTDGSHPNDFAICYRVSERYGLQVIPGDPTPVKLPVSTLANNVGVTAGLVVRLGR